MTCSTETIHQYNIDYSCPTTNLTAVNELHHYTFLTFPLNEKKAHIQSRQTYIVVRKMWFLSWTFLSTTTQVTTYSSAHSCITSQPNQLAYVVPTTTACHLSEKFNLHFLSKQLNTNQHQQNNKKDELSNILWFLLIIFISFLLHNYSNRNADYYSSISQLVGQNIQKHAKKLHNNNSSNSRSSRRSSSNSKIQ